MMSPPSPNPSPSDRPRRMYMDNAATSFPKPRAVHEAMARYATEIGASAGRGAYDECLQSAQILSDCRRKLNKLFHGQDPNHFVFTLNCTDALNLAIKGLIQGPPAHAVCSQIDHNSILRPLAALESAGVCTVTRVAIDSKSALVDPDELKRAIRPETKLIALAHASNVTGTIQPTRAIGQIAREHGIPFLLDAAQSAGHIPIDLRADPIDLLAAPGHKALLGPQGTGLLYVRPGLEQILRPHREGGTGTLSDDARQPDLMPDKYEAGTHNAIGIAGLAAGVDWILEQGVEKLAAHDLDLVRTFIDGAGGVEGLTYHGPQGVKNRLGVFSVTLQGFDPQELAAVLESHYGILTRAGLHCAPLAHQALGTLQDGGTTRFSFSPFLTKQDVKYATDALAEIAAATPSPAGRGRGVT
jgi:cysteine desulfurase/selenocysteine lyase